MPSLTYSMFGLGTFPSYPDAQVALMKLQDSGFLTCQLSFLANSIALYNDWLSTSPSSRHIASQSSFGNPLANNLISGLKGIVNHPDEIMLSGQERVVTGGRLGSLLLSKKSSSHAVVAALKTLKLPEETAQIYRDRLHRGDFLVGVECSKRDIVRAEEILQDCRIRHWRTSDLTKAVPQNAASVPDERGEDWHFYAIPDYTILTTVPVARYRVASGLANIDG